MTTHHEVQEIETMFEVRNRHRKRAVPEAQSERKSRRGLGDARRWVTHGNPLTREIDPPKEAELFEEEEIRSSLQ